jgi:hypothetical protein
MTFLCGNKELEVFDGDAVYVSEGFDKTYIAWNDIPPEMMEKLCQEFRALELGWKRCDDLIRTCTLRKS